MIVTQEVFEQQLRAAEASARSPEAGLFGPGSSTWTIAREPIVFLGAGRAALLQLSHPYVAHAIDQHSSTRSDPIGRFNLTFLYVYGMIFGDLAHALGSARRVRAIHDAVHGIIDEDVGPFRKGDRYRAHDPGALVWVWATLLETSVMLHEACLGPIADAEKDRILAEMRRFAWLFGVADEHLPQSYRAFSAYCAEMAASGTLAVGRPAREIGDFLFTAARPAARPLLRWYRVMTAGLLPEPLRAPWGMRFGRVEQAVFGRSMAAIRASYPRLPARVRRVPAFIEASHRLSGKPGPDRIGRKVEQLLLRFISPTAAPSTSGSACPVPH
ncbi:MAG: oxygenase MpaB family protein [Byssovorax sp.]